MENITMASQRQMFNPWSLPDDFTVFQFAPDDVRPLLHPHWQTQKAVHPVYSYFFGLYYLVMGVAAIIGNSMVLRIFSRYQALRTPTNMLIMNLAVSDLLLMISLIPECVFNFFMGGPWQFGELGCLIHGFCGALFGYSQITTLVLISWDRFKVIVGGFASAPMNYKKVSMIILFNWIWSIGWSLAPLLGWGGYALDGMLGTCSFDAYTKTINNKSHVMAACFFQFAFPIIIIIGCYYFIVQAIFQHEDELRQQAKKMNVTSLRSNVDQQAVSAEIRAAKIAIINVTLWIVAWTPFAIVCMLGTWGESSYITPLISELPVLFAKTSAVYNPIVYALSHPKYRTCLKEMYPWICIVVKDRKTADQQAVDSQSVISNKTESSSAFPVTSTTKA